VNQGLLMLRVQDRCKALGKLCELLLAPVVLLARGFSEKTSEGWLAPLPVVPATMVSSDLDLVGR